MGESQKQEKQIGPTGVQRSHNRAIVAGRSDWRHRFRKGNHRSSPTATAPSTTGIRPQYLAQRAGSRTSKQPARCRDVRHDNGKRRHPMGPKA